MRGVRSFLLLVIVFVGSVGYAQSIQDQIDSIERILPSIQQFDKRFEALKNLSTSYVLIDPQKGVDYGYFVALFRLVYD